MKFLVSLISLFLLFCNIAPSASAETGYIIDQIIVSLRDQPANNHAVLQTLSTDTPVEILSTQGEFYKVRTEKGLEGYVLRSYIVKSTPKSVIIEQLQKERDQLKEKVSRLTGDQSGLVKQLETSLSEKETALKENEQRNTILAETVSATKEELRDVTQKHTSLLEESTRVIDTAMERDRLKIENTQLSTEIQALRGRNMSLVNTGMIKWFLAGGGVFFLGWLIGKISRKQRTRL